MPEPQEVRQRGGKGKGQLRVWKLKQKKTKDFACFLVLNFTAKRLDLCT